MNTIKHIVSGIITLTKTAILLIFIGGVFFLFALPCMLVDKLVKN